MLSTTAPNPIVAFAGDELIAFGSFADVSLAVQTAQAQAVAGPILAFDAVTSEVVDVDPRVVSAPLSPVASANEPDPSDEIPRGPGRPKLGVVAREVTLLPRHWDWLASQPGGASAALRRLVEQARSASVSRDRVRRAQESAYRFMSAVLGNQPHYEEATRALFAGDRERFAVLSEPWPRDPRDHARHLADSCFL